LLSSRRRSRLLRKTLTADLLLRNDFGLQPLTS